MKAPNPKLGLCDSNLSLCKTNLGLLQHISSAQYYIYTLNNAASWIMVYFHRVTGLTSPCWYATDSSRRTILINVFIFSSLIPPSVQPVSAWNICRQWCHRGFCAQSAGEGGHSSAQHAPVGGKHRDFRWHHAQLRCLLLVHLPLRVLFSLQINGSEKQACRELHIAYRYGDHYDSVRRIGDNSESPAQLCVEVL